ncbi:MAG: hypothetical protein K2Q09_10680 [Phycisphaerales bacterium]|nr:hypothetical protein [Phycisphaerales bacterium]
MRKTLVTTAAALILAGSALAQPPADDKNGGGTGTIGFQSVQQQRDKAGKKADPPTLDLKGEEGATWPMIATILFVISCGVVAVIPPKRGHQD